MLLDNLGLNDDASSRNHRYIHLNLLCIRLHDNSTAIDFWRQHETEYPLLSKMAKIYTGISPGSVPVESLLSCAGFLLNSKRSMMAPYKADRVTFIHNS